MSKKSVQTQLPLEWIKAVNPAVNPAKIEDLQSGILFMQLLHTMFLTN